MKKDLLTNLLRKEILARIGQGTYPPGSKLPPEREMAAELHVSRITLRQAIAALRRMGIVHSRHGSGNYVRELTRLRIPEELKGEIPGFSDNALADIVEARRALETVTAGLAALRRGRAHLAALRRDLEAMAQNADDLTLFVPADMRFHQVLAEASGNRLLARLMEAIAEQQRLSMLLTVYRSGEERFTVADHARILAAVEKGDAKAAQAAMKRHLAHMMARYGAPRGGTGGRKARPAGGRVASRRGSHHGAGSRA